MQQTQTSVEYHKVATGDERVFYNAMDKSHHIGCVREEGGWMVVKADGSFSDCTECGSSSGSLPAHALDLQSIVAGWNPDGDHLLPGREEALRVLEYAMRKQADVVMFTGDNNPLNGIQRRERHLEDIRESIRSGEQPHPVEIDMNGDEPRVVKGRHILEAVQEMDDVDSVEVTFDE